MVWNKLSMITLALASVSAFAQDATPAQVATPTPPKSEVKAQSKEEAKKAAIQKLEEKKNEMSELRQKSTEIMSRMAEAAKDGTLVNTKEGVELLQELVDQMKEVNERLMKLEEEVEDIKGWIEGQNEALPIMANDILNLNRSKPSMYMQLQWRTQTAPATRQSGFRNRRIRLGGQFAVDTKTALKYSFDLGTGGNQTAAQLRDAYLIYDVIPSDTQVGLQIRGGQQPLLLGYELERSSGDREFPERARYNQLFFSGERSTGVTALYGLNENVFVHAGIMNALTYDDPEQRALGNDSTGRKIGYTGGVRYHSETLDIGVSAFRGTRPSFAVAKGPAAADPANVVAPAVARRAYYVDLTYLPPAINGLFIRGEYMWGRDRNNLGQATSASRNSSASFGQVNIKGWHTTLGYNLNTRNQISLKMEQTDPNTAGNNTVITGLGLGYQYWIGPTSKIGFFVEEFREPGRKFKVWTVRTTFRF